MTATNSNRLYIVDDSSSIRSRLAELLSPMGGVRIVGQASSAAEAVAGIAGTRPDAVLLDLHLPDRCGIDVLRAIHPQFPEIVFVVLTNQSEPQYRRACARAGAAYFLDKSTEFDRVRAVIAEIAATPH